MIEREETDKPTLCFADLCFCPNREDILLCVIEDSTDPRTNGVVTSLALIRLDSGDVSIISEGWDFYASPKFSPSGKKLAFLRWNHPNMPWQSCQLVLADVVFESDSLILENEKIVAGAEDMPTAAQQPQWLSDRSLLFMYDKCGWMQAWMHTVDGVSKPVLKKIIDEDFAEPLWRLGDSSYAILDSERIFCASLKEGIANLSIVDVMTGIRYAIKSDYVSVRSVQQIDGRNVAFIGSKVDAGGAVVKATLTYDTSPGAAFFTLRRSDEQAPTAGYIPFPMTLKLGDPQNRALYAHYFPPTNPSYTGLPGEKPPCILSVHAGPTMKADPGFSWERLLYTSRGWSWCGFSLDRTIRIIR